MVRSNKTTKWLPLLFSLAYQINLAMRFVCFMHPQIPSARFIFARLCLDTDLQAFAVVNRLDATEI